MLSLLDFLSNYRYYSERLIGRWRWDF